MGPKLPFEIKPSLAIQQPRGAFLWGHGANERHTKG